MSAELGVVYQELQALFTASSADVWGTRVWADEAAAGETRPYLVYSFVSAVDTRQQIKPYMEMIVDVVCVADTQSEALTGSARIETILDNSGRQDGGISAAGMVGDGTWSINTVARDAVLHVIEKVNGKNIYHEGGRFSLIVEKVG